MMKLDEIKIPHEIKDLLGSLSNEERWKIIELLLNRRKLSYSDLRRILKFTEDDKGKFNYHLKELQKSGWLRKQIGTVSDSEENQKSFYMLSKFGLKAIEGAMKAMDRQSYAEDPFIEIQKRKLGELSNLELLVVGQHVLSNFMTIGSESKPIGVKTQIPENNKPISPSGKTITQLFNEFGYRPAIALSRRE